MAKPSPIHASQCSGSLNICPGIGPNATCDKKCEKRTEALLGIVFRNSVNSMINGYYFSEVGYRSSSNFSLTGRRTSRCRQKEYLPLVACMPREGI